ncbi:ParA family protein [Limimaricola litoreus]|nr:ParA family protein [Limimaricola litoreus]
MKTMTIAMQKGGAGKTALSRNLAALAAEDGQRVLLVDLDPQGTTRRWLARRQADHPTMLDDDPEPGELPAILPHLSSHFDLVVIDTPPQVPGWMQDVMGASDLVVIPSRASTDDLDAIGPTISAANRAGVPFAFVMTMVNPQARLTDAAARELAQHGRVAPVNINNRIVYAEMGGAGLSVIEANNPDALAEMQRLWQYLKGVM